MTCDLPSLRLSEHHDGILSGDDCAAVERHLRECPTCGDLRKDLEDLARLCRKGQGEPVRMPAELRDRIVAMLTLAETTPAEVVVPPPDASAEAGN